MVTENGILSILKDDYPIDPSGTTAADRLAREIGITGSDREAYQDAMTKLFPSLRNADWSLFVKFLSFAESARFDRSFYAAFASFIKNDFPEQYKKFMEMTI